MLMLEFKTSNYNHYLYDEETGHYLVYNSISNGLAKLDQEIYNCLKAGKKGILEIKKDESKKELFQNLYKGHIIIDEDLDEIEFLRTKFNMGKYGNRNLSLTIISTLDCNMACLYCYESDNLKHLYPYNELEEDIIKFVETRIATMGYSSIFVNWYGGEPLLNKEFIFSLSKKLLKLCKAKDVKYGSMIVTNGTILNKNIVNKLKRYKMRNMQITLDGPQDIHDKRRPFKNSNKSSFLTITRNIKRVMGIIPIQIRINVDKTNFSNTLKLIEKFESMDFLNRSNKISVYLGYTREWTAKCNNILPYCFSMKEFSKAEIEFQKMLISKGLIISNMYPSPASFCVAASPHGFVIETGGELHKCWSDVGNSEAFIGNIRDKIELNSKYLKWLSYDPLI